MIRNVTSTVKHSNLNSSLKLIKRECIYWTGFIYKISFLTESLPSSICLLLRESAPLRHPHPTPTRGCCTQSFSGGEGRTKQPSEQLLICQEPRSSLCIGRVLKKIFLLNEKLPVRSRFHHIPFVFGSSGDHPNILAERPVLC